MNIKEFEGRRYIAFNNLLIVIVTSIVCLVVALFILIAFLYMKSDQIYSNPLVYGARIYNASGCSCMDSKGYFFFDKEKVWRQEDIGAWGNKR